MPVFLIGLYFVLVSVTASEAVLSGLSGNVVYFWRVTATDGTNISDWSTVWSF